MTTPTNTNLVWEQRWHPLREEWVLFTSHRGGRPWIGETVRKQEVRPPSYDPTCALCPGNERLHGKRNLPYTSAYCFTNDLPCFSDDAPVTDDAGELYRTLPAFGTAEVVCYHPDHSKTFAELTDAEAHAVLQMWTERYRKLGDRPTVDHVLIFENNGALVGTSNPHPHCQIYAGNLIYGFTEREVASSQRYHQRTGRSLLLDIVEREAKSPRVICQNDAFLACVPWFARYAYEVHIYPRRQVSSLADLTDSEPAQLAALMSEVSIRYDNLWQMRMPYVMAIHQAPTDGGDHAMHPFHIEYHPPLRKPDTMKYLAGPEIGGGSMTNESNPDEKAAELKAVSSVLYREAI
jgi:UDPglucose--hexose-1-phosphate uridylyltransferase